ncbi:MAG TPA: hypothetical protein VKO83_03045 [Steroidobacteraceae bacterium]|nr:hypothetical protein [Steroidobacteraceae bacterium]
MINAIRRGLGRLRGQSPLRRELYILAAALLLAVILLPPLIWVAGQVFLGDYIRSPTGAPTGGPLALTLDYVRGVFALSPGHWLVLLGPYLLLLAFRGGRALLKM